MIEYIFGTEITFGQSMDVLKVISDKPVVMTGSWNLERDYADSVIVDNFNIKREIRRKESHGTYYVWYQIENHYRYIDKFTPKEKRINGRIDGTEDAICETTEEMTTGFADIEDAICELTEIITG